MKTQKKDEALANVYYWLGYLMSDVEQIDSYAPLKENIERLKEALFKLVREEEE